MGFAVAVDMEQPHPAAEPLDDAVFQPAVAEEARLAIGESADMRPRREQRRRHGNLDHGVVVHAASGIVPKLPHHPGPAVALAGEGSRRPIVLAAEEAGEEGRRRVLPVVELKGGEQMLDRPLRAGAARCRQAERVDVEKRAKPQGIFAAVWHGALHPAIGRGAVGGFSVSAFLSVGLRIPAVQQPRQAVGEPGLDELPQQVGELRVNPPPRLDVKNCSKSLRGCGMEIKQGKNSYAVKRNRD